MIRHVSMHRRAKSVASKKCPNLGAYAEATVQFKLRCRRVVAHVSKLTSAESSLNLLVAVFGSLKANPSTESGKVDFE